MKDDYYPTAWDTQANWLWHALDPTPVPVPAANREVGTVRAELPVVGAWHRQANCRGTKVDMFREWRKALDGCAKCGAAVGFVDHRLCRRCTTNTVTSVVQATSNGVRTGSLPKLSADDIAKIKRLRSRLMTNAAIAREMGVSLKLVRSVLAGTYTPRADA